MVGPIIAGNMAAHISWRWFFWVCVIAQALNLLGLIIFFPETRYERDEETPQAMSGDQQPDIEKEQGPATSELERQIQPETDACLNRGRPTRQQFHIFQGTSQKALANIWLHLWTPIEIFFFPIICWAAWTMAGAANTFLLLVLFESPILSNPPYNFSTANIGFANFAPAVGTVIALATCGPFADWVALRAAKKNKGIFEPEMRLPAIFPFLAISLIGLLVSDPTFSKKSLLQSR